MLPAALLAEFPVPINPDPVPCVADSPVVMPTLPELALVAVEDITATELVPATDSTPPWLEVS
jgi:hypothetical protein